MEKVKAKRDHPLNDPQARLMLALRFTEEDLQANREGYLAKQQRSKLNKNRAAWLLCFMLTFIAVPIFVTWTVIDGTRIRDTTASRLGIVGLIWIVGSGSAVYFWFNKRRFDRDLQKGDVQVVKGAVRVGAHPGRQRGLPYYLSAGNLVWSIGYILFAAFENGDPYAIYYAPHSKTILSAEWLGRREMSG